MVFAIKLLMYLRQGLIVDFLTFFFCLPISILALVWWLICWGIWLLETRSNVYWKNVLTEECGVSGDDLLIYESKRFSLLYFFKYWSDFFLFLWYLLSLFFFPFLLWYIIISLYLFKYKESLRSEKGKTKGDPTNFSSFI